MLGTNFKLNEVSLGRAVPRDEGIYKSRMHLRAGRYTDEKDSVKQGKADIKSMAFSMTKKGTRNFFNQIILYADIITEDLLLWVKENLALHGRLLQVYTDYHHARRYHSANEKIFSKFIAPSHYYSAYCQVFGENGDIILRSVGNPHTPHKDRGKDITINLVKTQDGLVISKENPFDNRERAHTICIDRDKGDALQLHILLLNLSNKNELVDELMDAPILPYVSSLCKWGNGCANCKELETAVVDEEGHVKTCWNGQPVGKVGMSVAEIHDNIKNRRREKERVRGCGTCKKKTSCARCIFPGPLSEGEYCHLKRAFDTEAVTKVLRHLDILKEI